jgi:hypothetical protein
MHASLGDFEGRDAAAVGVIHVDHADRRDRWPTARVDWQPARLSNADLDQEFAGPPTP